MNLSVLRIVFLGTPDFAVASLNALIEAGCQMVGVVTAPDKPAGRGMKLTESAVKQYAVSKNLPILQPEKLKNPEFLAALKEWKADLQVVVAFRMLPVVVWDMPPMGTINVHGSLLPQYRGAAPINWAIINGDAETGVTTFKLQHDIDTGDILLQASTPILPTDSVGTMHDKLMQLGAETLVKTLEGLCNKTLTPTPQTEIAIESLKHAPKLFTETCQINWNASANTIHNLVRGLSPYPAAFTHLNEKKLKVFDSKAEIAKHNFEIGKPFTDHKSYLKFSCTDGFVHILDLQLEGKKRMLVQDFLRGFRFE